MASRMVPKGSAEVPVPELLGATYQIVPTYMGGGEVVFKKKLCNEKDEIGNLSAKKI